MRYRGEITVFLSLTLICVLSLVLGLVESARTAGARLYLRMASDSAVSSVMSYYNRNLWDRYQLLFLEYESEAAIKETFGRYLDFYLEQANMYPARRKNVTLSGMSRMVDENVLSPIRCKTLLDGGRRRTKNLYGVFKRTVPAGQVRQ